MEKRKLGNSGLEVYPLALGGNVFGWTVDEAGSFEILDRFAGAGFNLIDTADSYSKWVPGNRGGESETIIGRWLRRSGNRKKVIVATKVGSEMGHNLKGLSKAYILEEVENSLRRLQTDYIDLYQSHFDDPETPIEETLEAYNQLVGQGKVRAIGASNFSADRLSKSLEISGLKGYPSYECLQTEYNLCERTGFEASLGPFCRQKGLGVLTYFSLASGFLTGKYRSEKDLTGRARAGMVSKYLNDRGLRILDALDQVAREHSSTHSPG
jgi:aryl-alcohol dehydrogenase-like predicted oxidoreductase